MNAKHHIGIRCICPADFFMKCQQRPSQEDLLCDFCRTDPGCVENRKLIALGNGSSADDT